MQVNASQCKSMRVGRENPQNFHNIIEPPPEPGVSSPRRRRCLISESLERLSPRARTVPTVEVAQASVCDLRWPISQPRGGEAVDESGHWPAVVSSSISPSCARCTSPMLSAHLGGQREAGCVVDRPYHPRFVRAIVELLGKANAGHHGILCRRDIAALRLRSAHAAHRLPACDVRGRAWPALHAERAQRRRPPAKAVRGGAAVLRGTLEGQLEATGRVHTGQKVARGAPHWRRRRTSRAGVVAPASPSPCEHFDARLSMCGAA